MNPEELFEAISDPMQARSEEEVGQVLKEHPELLGKRPMSCCSSLSTVPGSKEIPMRRSSSARCESFCRP